MHRIYFISTPFLLRLLLLFIRLFSSHRFSKDLHWCLFFFAYNIFLHSHANVCKNNAQIFRQSIDNEKKEICSRFIHLSIIKRFAFLWFCLKKDKKKCKSLLKIIILLSPIKIHSNDAKMYRISLPIFFLLLFFCVNRNRYGFRKFAVSFS